MEPIQAAAASAASCPTPPLQDLLSPWPLLVVVVSWGGACALDHVVAVLAVEVVWSRSRRLKDGIKAMKTRNPSGNPSASLRFFHLADAASCFLHPASNKRRQVEEAVQSTIRRLHDTYNPPTTKVVRHH